MPRFEKPPRILLWITLLWLIIFVVAFSDAGVPFPTWFLMAGAFVILGVAWVVRAVVAITKQSGYQRLIRPHIRYWVSIPAILLGAVVLGGSPALLTARVYLSSDPLIQAEAPEGMTDRWIGLFHVREVSRFDKEVRFLTNECGLVDMCGVIFSPDARPRNRGEDSFVHLYGPWWHWYQSW